MPRRERPSETTRSEHWLRILVNKNPSWLNKKVARLFQWPRETHIEWLSPKASDGFAEYYDQEFLEKLGITAPLKVPLSNFWPPGGPRWDGLARVGKSKYILVEAKAYVEEVILDYRSNAKPSSLAKIIKRLNAAKAAFHADAEAPWETPLYQYANRLAHLYFLRQSNNVDAYMLFICFANAPDVEEPTSVEAWRGAIRLAHKCLGLHRKHPFKDYLADLIVDVKEMKIQ